MCHKMGTSELLTLHSWWLLLLVILDGALVFGNSNSYCGLRYGKWADGVEQSNWKNKKCWKNVSQKWEGLSCLPSTPGGSSSLSLWMGHWCLEFKLLLWAEIWMGKRHVIRNIKITWENCVVKMGRIKLLNMSSQWLSLCCCARDIGIKEFKLSCRPRYGEWHRWGGVM